MCLFSQDDYGAENEPLIQFFQWQTLGVDGERIFPSQVIPWYIFLKCFVGHGNCILVSSSMLDNNGNILPGLTFYGI